VLPGAPERKQHARCPRLGRQGRRSLGDECHGPLVRSHTGGTIGEGHLSIMSERSPRRPAAPKAVLLRATSQRRAPLADRTCYAKLPSR
jgi:hypothetical protein